MDMELDLDGPSQAPARPGAGSRFAPRGSKPVQKPEPIQLKNDSKEKIKVEEHQIVEDVDQLVNEIDVYFSPSLDHNTKLYVLQYPMRPTWRPYELDEKCKEVRVKPDSGEVEIDLAIDVGSDQNYDHNADPRIKITKQTLSSTWTPPGRAAYAVGVLSGNELHLNPVHAVAQLRPSLEHLKPGGLEKKSAGNIKGEVIVKVEEIKEEKLSVSSAKENCMWNRLSRPSLFMSGRLCSTMVLGVTFQPPVYIKCWRKMTRIPFAMSKRNYINTLCPDTYNNVKVRGPSIRSLRSLPLDERFKAWFREGHAVNKFVTLKHLALEESDDEILAVILKHARLVQGNWVAKSSLVYGKDTGLEVLARDNVLAQFRKNLVFSSRQLPQKLDLRNATKAVLNVFARPSGNDWRFGTPRDISFLKLHPHIEEQQEEAWKKLEEQINSILVQNRSKTAPKSTVLVNHAPGQRSHKAAGSKIENQLVFKSMPSETEEALLNALKTILRQGGFRLSQICEYMRYQTAPESRHPKISVREAEAVADIIDAFPHEFHKITNEVAVNIHGVFVLRSSPNNSQHDALRKVVIDLLIGQGPNAKIKKGSVAEAAKLQLGREMNNEEFRKVITELCVPQNSAWVLKVGDGAPNILK